MSQFGTRLTTPIGPVAPAAETAGIQRFGEIRQVLQQSAQLAGSVFSAKANRLQQERQQSALRHRIALGDASDEIAQIALEADELQRDTIKNKLATDNARKMYDDLRDVEMFGHMQQLSEMSPNEQAQWIADNPAFDPANQASLGRVVGQRMAHAANTRLMVDIAERVQRGEEFEVSDLVQAELDATGLTDPFAVAAFQENVLSAASGYKRGEIQRITANRQKRVAAHAQSNIELIIASILNDKTPGQTPEMLAQSIFDNAKMIPGLDKNHLPQALAEFINTSVHRQLANPRGTSASVMKESLQRVMAGKDFRQLRENINKMGTFDALDRGIEFQSNEIQRKNASAIEGVAIDFGRADNESGLLDLKRQASKSLTGSHLTRTNAMLDGHLYQVRNRIGNLPAIGRLEQGIPLPGDIGANFPMEDRDAYYIKQRQDHPTRPTWDIAASMARVGADSNAAFNEWMEQWRNQSTQIDALMTYRHMKIADPITAASWRQRASSEEMHDTINVAIAATEVDQGGAALVTPEKYEQLTRNILLKAGTVSKIYEQLDASTDVKEQILSPRFLRDSANSVQANAKIAEWRVAAGIPRDQMPDAESMPPELRSNILGLYKLYFSEGLAVHPKDSKLNVPEIAQSAGVRAYLDTMRSVTVPKVSGKKYILPSHILPLGSAANPEEMRKMTSVFADAVQNFAADAGVQPEQVLINNWRQVGNRVFFPVVEQGLTASRLLGVDGEQIRKNVMWFEWAPSTKTRFPVGTLSEHKRQGEYRVLTGNRRLTRDLKQGISVRFGDDMSNRILDGVGDPEHKAIFDHLSNALVNPNAISDAFVLNFQPGMSTFAANENEIALKMMDRVLTGWPNRHPNLPVPNPNQVPDVMTEADMRSLNQLQEDLNNLARDNGFQNGFVADTVDLSSVMRAVMERR